MILFASAAMLFAGCAKEKFSIAECDGVLTDVTFSAVMQSAGSKAVADNDGMAANVNRCILEVYYGDDLFTRMYAPVNSQKKASFTLQLVSNRTYKLAFWADCVDDPSGEVGIATDKYYTTNAEGGLQAVALNGTYLGNGDARDAFAFSGDYTVEQGGSSFDVTLTRPFAQINVITTDVATVKKVTSAKPEKVDVTIKNAVAKYNVLAGTAVENSTADLNYEASLYNWDATKSECTLSMDYIFAENEKAVVDIDWKAKKTNNADVAHSFTSVPYQRNYRTNIKGALLTTTGKWNVTVDPIWTYDGTGEFEVIVLVANTVEEAQTLINANAGDQSVSKTVEIQVKEQIAATKELYIPDNTTTPSWVFKIEDMTSAGQIVVKDQTPADNTKNYKMSAEVALPAGVSASQTTFNTPNAHGVVSGSFGRIDATTSATTLEIKAGATVTELYVHKGNVALYGTVGSIKRGENNAANVIVDIYDGAFWTNWATEKSSTGIKPVVNLGTYKFDPTGYNVEGSAVIANETSPATWTVAVLNEWKYYAAKEFSQISGKNITITSPEELALFAKENATYKTYNITLGCDLDLSAHIWNPIPSFQGNFDGNNKTITGLKITGENNNVGLFGSMDGSEALGTPATFVKNLTIKGADIQGNVYVGTLAGFAGYDRTITNVIIDGCKVVGTQYVGGVAGSSIDDYNNCEVKGGTVSGVDQVGGMIGYLWIGSIENCKVSGTVVTSTSERAGGLVGKINVDNDDDPTGTSKINGNTVTATAAAPDMAGGIAAQIMGDKSNYEIKNNKIDVKMTAPKTSPIAVLRASQDVAFTSKLEENITGNTWTTATYAENSYVYTDAETGAGDQIIWNGEPTNVWTNYAAKSFSSIDETNKIINITSAAELALIAKTLNSGKAPLIGGGYYYYEGWKINLANDIDLAGHDWVPIGNNSYMFYGAFDGKGYTVSNMTISTNFTYQWNGLFGAVQSTDSFDGAYFGNVVFDKASVKSTYFSSEPDSRVGVLAGGYNRPIDKVTVKNSSVESVKYASAIAGINYCSVTNCTVENTSINGLRVGGIVGTFYGASITNCVIKGTTTLTRSVVEDSEVGGFTSRTLENGGSATHTISGNTIYNTVKINGVNVSSAMAEEGSSSPYVGSCVGRDYNNTTTCENNNIGIAE